MFIKLIEECATLKEWLVSNGIVPFSPSKFRQIAAIIMGTGLFYQQRGQTSIG
jgi:hypothetical protein